MMSLSLLPLPLQRSAGGSPRSRIVVNLDEGQDAGKARGSRLRGRGDEGGGGRKAALIFLVLLALVFAAIGAGAYFWWRSYQSGPNYSLALLVDAVQRNDMAEFDKLVDTDRIVDNFVPQVVEKASAQNSFGLPGGLGGIGSGPGRKQLQSLVLKAAPQVKQRVHDEVAAQVKELSARAESKPFFLVALALPFVVDTKQEGDAARVNATLKDRPIELTMQRAGERWKIVGVKDDVLVSRILENIARDLPANASSSPQIPDEVRRQLEKKLPGKLPDIPVLTK